MSEAVAGRSTVPAGAGAGAAPVNGPRRVVTVPVGVNPSFSYSGRPFAVAVRNTAARPQDARACRIRRRPMPRRAKRSATSTMPMQWWVPP